VGRWAEAFRTEVAKYDKGQALKCQVIDLGYVRRPATAMERYAAAYNGRGRGIDGEYRILCRVQDACKERQVLVVVPEHATWMKLSSARTSGARGTALVTAYHDERDGHWSEATRGNVIQVPRGANLVIRGLGLLRRYTDPTQAPLEGIEPALRPASALWVASFDRQCPHEGMPCPAQDGGPMPAIEVKSDSCDLTQLGSEVAVSVGDTGDDEDEDDEDDLADAF
jgi:hypothetical protein